VSHSNLILGAEIRAGAMCSTEEGAIATITASSVWRILIPHRK
jgi:hypothetical protein